MKVLTVDIGNTYVKCAVYIDDMIVKSWKMLSVKEGTVEDYFQKMKTHLPKDKVDFASVSSVVPPISKTFEQIFNMHLKIPFHFVNALTELGLKFLVKDPSFIGADLVVNAFAAKEKYKTNCIIIDLGTATTIQLVGADGMFYGTAIFPGVQTSANSIISKAAQLKNFEFNVPEKVLGTNTVESLSTGIIRSHAYAIDLFIDNIKKEYDHLHDIKVIMTGGGAQMVTGYTQNVDVVDEDLLLQGLSRVKAWDGD